MNSIILKFVMEIIVFIVSIIVAFIEHRPDNRKEKMLFAGAVIFAIIAFASFFLWNEVPAPNIERETDYSAIYLYSDEQMDIEYKISTNGDSSDKWIKYEEPFRLERSAIIYARASTLWYTSEQVSRDVYVAENGLVYFSSAEKPGDTIVNIKAEYNYNDPVINSNAGNYYTGYEIKKNDIKVIGTDLNGNEKEIENFVYSPKVLKSGKNDIKVEYLITDNTSVQSHLYIDGNVPSMINMKASYIGGTIYIDTILDSSYFKVNGIYEDGTIKEITDYLISPIEHQFTTFLKNK